jgi:hypothetical protein
MQELRHFPIHYIDLSILEMLQMHIFKHLEVPSATSRYCLVETAIHYSEVMKLLHKLYPTLCLPEK